MVSMRTKDDLTILVHKLEDRHQYVLLERDKYTELMARVRDVTVSTPPTAVEQLKKEIKALILRSYRP